MPMDYMPQDTVDDRVSIALQACNILSLLNDTELYIIRGLTSQVANRHLPATCRLCLDLLASGEIDRRARQRVELENTTRDHMRALILSDAQDDAS